MRAPDATPELPEFGLRPRPVPDGAVLAVLAAAAEALLGETAVEAGRTEDRHLAWRFSGRWWSSPAVLRRERPGAASGRTWRPVRR